MVDGYVLVVVVMVMAVAVVLVVEVECAGGCVGGGEQQHFTGGAQRAACNLFRRPHAAQICNVGLVLPDYQIAHWRGVWPTYSRLGTQ